MALNANQVADCAAKIAAHLFGGVVAAVGGGTTATANVNWADIQAAVSAVDAAFDSSPVLGGQTVIQYLASQIPAPVSGGTAQQKTILACYVLLKRAGLV